MRLHELKIDPGPFEEIQSGAKTYEIRDCTDRDFRVGDLLWLFEYRRDDHPASVKYTGDSVIVEVAHITRGTYGLQPDLCVLGITQVRAIPPHSVMSPAQREEFNAGFAKAVEVSNAAT